jgi:hypothetical protein
MLHPRSPVEGLAHSSTQLYQYGTDPKGGLGLAQARSKRKLFYVAKKDF